MTNHEKAGMKMLFKKYGMPLLKGVLLLGILLAAFFPVRYNSGLYGYIPGLLLLSLLSLSLVHLLILRRTLRFEIENMASVCLRGEEVKVILKIENPSFFSCPNLQVTLGMTDFFLSEDSVYKRNPALGRRSKAEIPFSLKMNHLGVYSFGIQEMRLYDLLGIFSLGFAGTPFQRFTVLPKIYSGGEVTLEEKLLEENHSLSKSAVSDGFDYSSVREYVLGDPMKRIHWKLSAHSSTYLTKLTESSRKNDLTVIMDFVTGLKGEATSQKGIIVPGIFDGLIETALSLIYQARQKDVDYTLFFADGQGELIRSMPKGSQDHEDLVQMLPTFHQACCTDFPDGAELVEKEGGLGNRSANIILCTSQLTDEAVDGLMAVRKQHRNAQLFYILPPIGTGARQEADTEKDTLSRQIERLTDRGVSCYFVEAEGGEGHEG